MNNTHPKRHPDSVETAESFGLFTEDRVIELFSISKRTLRNWRNKRKLPYYKIGRIVVYRYTDLLSFIDQHKVARRR